MGPSKLVEINYEDPEDPMAPQQRVTPDILPMCYISADLPQAP